jgi:predicted transcriptional regulator
MSRTQRLGERELDIMNALWQLQDASVSDVRDRLLENGVEAAYTTVQTMLNRLEAKGQVTRRLDGRAYRYRPRVRQSAAAGKAVRALIQRFFSGSAEALAARLVSDDLSEAELERVRRLIDQERKER